MRRAIRTRKKQPCSAKVRGAYGRMRNCSNYARPGQEYCGIHLKQKYPALKTTVPDDTDDIEAAVKRWNKFYGLKR